MPALPTREMLDAVQRSSERDIRRAALSAAAASWAGILTKGPYRDKEVIDTAIEFEKYLRGER